MPTLRKLLLPLLLALALPVVAKPTAEVSDLEEFLRLCDMPQELLMQESAYAIGVDRQFYRDSYAVRAMAVAYDITGEQRYLDACEFWSDQMLAYQKDMTPAGAYYIHYHRKPGETTNSWYLADAASIALGVLATANRTDDPERREAYLESIKWFTQLVLDNYRKDGGITDGIWEKYDGPWWCSTGIFGSLAFLLHAETGEQKYLDAGYEAIDWLNTRDFKTVLPLTYNIDKQGPSLIMYFFEAYSAGLPYLHEGTPRAKAAWVKINEAREWMKGHLHGLGAQNDMSYNSQWGSKAGGLPFHLYVWARYVPNSHELLQEADQELAYTRSIMWEERRFEEDQHELSQLMNFTLMSLAEKLAPGYLYRP